MGDVVHPFTHRRSAKAQLISVGEAAIQATPDLLLELHVIPSDVEADKAALIALRKDEIDGEVDWGPAPWAK